jgi:hypothetical protein
VGFPIEKVGCVNDWMSTVRSKSLALAGNRSLGSSHLNGNQSGLSIEVKIVSRFMVSFLAVAKLKCFQT